MTFVIYVGANTWLMQSRKLVLERAGYSVITATNEHQLVSACSQHQIQVTILSETLSAKVKRGLLSLLRSSHSSIKVLELYPRFQGKSLEDADAWLEAPIDVPRDLSDTVRRLAIKAATHRAKQLCQEVDKTRSDARYLRSAASSFRKKSAALRRPPRRTKNG